MAEEQTQGKIVVVGDGACGKTCLLEVFRHDKFPEEYIPTVVDNFSKDITVDGSPVSLILWDTAGQEDFDSVRPLSYKDTNLVLLCYSIENKDMLVNIQEKWTFEITNYCHDTPFFLVGLKSDIRDLEESEIDKSKIVSIADGEKLADEVGAAGFYECSALTGYNVEKIFEEAGRKIIEANKAPSMRSRGPSYCGLC